MESAIGDPGKTFKSSDQNNSGLFRWLTILVSLASLSVLVMYQTDQESLNKVPAVRQSARSKVTCARAERLFQKGLYAEAYDLFARASRLNEHNPAAWTGQAKAALRTSPIPKSQPQHNLWSHAVPGSQPCTEVGPLVIPIPREVRGGCRQRAESCLAVCLEYNPGNSAALTLVKRLTPNR